MSEHVAGHYVKRPYDASLPGLNRPVRFRPQPALQSELRRIWILRNLGGSQEASCGSAAAQIGEKFGKQTKTQFSEGLGGVVRETTRLWLKHHLGYDQTKYVVEQVRRRLKLLPHPKRLVEIWNSLPGVKLVTKFTNRKVATERIWKAIQGLGEVADAAPAAEPRVIAINAHTALGDVPAVDPATAQPAEPIATVGAQSPDVAPKKARSATKATRSKKSPKGESKPKGTREGSKAAQVVTMLQRSNGATLAEILEKMGWQKHTVRGFMAGAMKKAGYLCSRCCECNRGAGRFHFIDPTKASRA
jgi:hypothetical protein